MVETKRIFEGEDGLLIEDDLTTHKHPPKEVRAHMREKKLESAGDKGAEAAQKLEVAPPDVTKGKKSGSSNHLLFHQWEPDEDKKEET